MRQRTKDQPVMLEVEETDVEVVAFRESLGGHSPLDDLVRQGAQKMLQAALESEVDAFLARYEDRPVEKGNCLVVRNGRLPSREILTGAGPLEVQ